MCLKNSYDEQVQLFVNKNTGTQKIYIQLGFSFFVRAEKKQFGQHFLFLSVTFAGETIWKSTTKKRTDH
jgi:hypothetical protein